MIRVNLLPYHLRPIKRTPVPYLLSGLVFIIVLLSIVAAFVSNQATISSKRASLKQHQTELDSLKDIVKEYNALVEEKRLLADKLATINDIAKDRIIWSKQLWKLSQLAPKNFWYETLSVELKPFKEKQTAFNQQTQKEETKDVTIKKQVLTLTGYVIESEDGKYDVSPILLNFENDEEFSKLFQLQRPEIKDTIFEGYPVRRFSLEYLITPGGNKG